MGPNPRGIERVIDFSQFKAVRQSQYRLIVVSSMATASTRHLNAQGRLAPFCALR
jgi:hypothetical protein